MSESNRNLPLLMGCSLESLRGKLLGSDEQLSAYWAHFLALSREDSQWHSPYTVLAALVTEDEGDRERARRSVLKLVEVAPEALTSFEAQFHTHVASAPLGRWAVFYDWSADAGLFTPQEEEAIAAVMLEQAFLFPYQSLQSRMRAFDNQLLSNAFAVAAVGYVFGVKRQQTALGKRLFHHGICWLRFLLDNLPEGGYSPEGSTYHEQIVLPLAILASQLVAETEHMVSGTPSPAAVSPQLLELIQTSYRMVGPGGLLPAWDAYGFQAATVKSGLAYLSRLSGDATPLSLIEELSLWHRGAHPAWEIDDRVWTLVWWPERTESASPAFSPWMAESVGGALQSREQRTRVFQYWDRCGGMAGSGRAQVDPNAITFEAFGVPLLLDGAGHPGRQVIPIPMEAARDYAGVRTLETVREYCNAPSMTEEDALAFALDGSVGMSNSLIVDDEGWYVPRRECRGQGEALHTCGPLQVLRSDATDFYTDRYSITKAKRSSLLVRGQYALVTDDVVSSALHTLTWQAYARENVRLVEGAARRAVIETAEGIRCDLIPLQAGDLTLTPAENYPNQWAQRRSVLVRHGLPAATRQRIDVAIIPQNLLEVVEDLTGGWQRALDGVEGSAQTVALDTAYLSDPATYPEASRIFEKKIQFPGHRKRRQYLQVAMAGSAISVAVNGQAIPATTEQVGTIWKESATGQPWIFDVTEALREGENTLRIQAPFFHGETVAGAVLLCAEKEAQTVDVQRLGADSFRVNIGNEVDYLLANRQGDAAWLEGHTDARYAFLTVDEAVACAEVSQLSVPNLLQVRSQAPCSFAWNRSETHLSELVEGTGVVLRWQECELRVDLGGTIEISYRGAHSHRLHLEYSAQRLVVLNGEIIGSDEKAAEFQRNPHSGLFHLTLDLKPSVDSLTVTTATSIEEVYMVAVSSQSEKRDALLVAALQSENWQVQVAAAESCGRLGIREAVPVMLELFAGAEAELPYPALTHWWRWSKMLRGAHGDIKFEPTEQPVLAIKRWRVKRAVVTALGQIGDSRAIAPLETALTRGTDFFTVTSQLAVALGRLGGSSSIPVLQRCVNHAEVNTRVHARLALALLQGELERPEYEQRVGIN